MQTAKQRFSEVLREAATGEPQFITKHGERVAVVIDYPSYEREFEPRPSFAEFLVNGLGAIGLEDGFELPERVVDPPRDIGLDL